MSEIRKFIRQQEIYVVAVGIVLGFALKDFIEGFLSAFITPLLDKFMGGAGALQSKVTDVAGIRFKPGVFVETTITFACIVAAAYVLVLTYNKATSQIHKKDKEPKN